MERAEVERRFTFKWIFYHAHFLIAQAIPVVANPTNTAPANNPQPIGPDNNAAAIAVPTSAPVAVPSNVAVVLKAFALPSLKLPFWLIKSSGDDFITLSAISRSWKKK